MSKNTKNNTSAPKTVEELTAVLKWRLAKQPTLDDVTTMLDKGIVSKEEARQILFNEVKEDTTSERVEALKEQVKFLEGVVEKLANRGVGWINTYTYTPVYPTKYWVTYTSGSGTGLGSGTIYSVSANNAVSLSSSLTSGAVGSSGSNIVNC